MLVHTATAPTVQLFILDAGSTALPARLEPEQDTRALSEDRQLDPCLFVSEPVALGHCSDHCKDLSRESSMVPKTAARENGVSVRGRRRCVERSSWTRHGGEEPQPNAWPLMNFSRPAGCRALLGVYQASQLLCSQGRSRLRVMVFEDEEDDDAQFRSGMNAGQSQRHRANPESEAIAETGVAARHPSPLAAARADSSATPPDAKVPRRRGYRGVLTANSCNLWGVFSARRSTPDNKGRGEASGGQPERMVAGGSRGMPRSRSCRSRCSKKGWQVICVFREIRLSDRRVVVVCQLARQVWRRGCSMGPDTSCGPSRSIGPTPAYWSPSPFFCMASVSIAAVASLCARVLDLFSLVLVNFPVTGRALREGSTFGFKRAVWWPTGISSGQEGAEASRMDTCRGTSHGARPHNKQCHADLSHRRSCKPLNVFTFLREAAVVAVRQTFVRRLSRERALSVLQRGSDLSAATGINCCSPKDICRDASLQIAVAQQKARNGPAAISAAAECQQEAIVAPVSEAWSSCPRKSTTHQLRQVLETVILPSTAYKALHDGSTGRPSWMVVTIDGEIAWSGDSDLHLEHTEKNAGSGPTSFFPASRRAVRHKIPKKLQIEAALIYLDVLHKLRSQESVGSRGILLGVPQLQRCWARWLSFSANSRRRNYNCMAEAELFLLEAESCSGTSRSVAYSAPSSGTEWLAFAEDDRIRVAAAFLYPRTANPCLSRSDTSFERLANLHELVRSAVQPMRTLEELPCSTATGQARGHRCSK
ncbi:hypothetical protein CSUI_006561 [Cystoisospora suis]|uniref:Uncharacterized protein n=1 Tax=Cystoisospora suis TaxID=483139 RepID=A0A2C6KT28_9APIC|nr:hypothetical protein CSUI_006561 [Cystoisospora suis]